MYGVPECNIRGIPYGFKGFQERRYQKPVEVTKGNTDAIHLEGGSFLGTCSDQGDVGQIVKWYAARGCMDVGGVLLVGAGGGGGVREGGCLVCGLPSLPTGVTACQPGAGHKDWLCPLVSITWAKRHTSSASPAAGWICGPLTCCLSSAACGAWALRRPCARSVSEPTCRLRSSGSPRASTTTSCW